MLESEIREEMGMITNVKTAHLEAEDLINSICLALFLTATIAALV